MAQKQVRSSSARKDLVAYRPYAWMVVFLRDLHSSWISIRLNFLAIPEKAPWKIRVNGVLVSTTDFEG
jgi:hypothetical protein